MQQTNNLLDESSKFLLQIQNETKLKTIKKQKRKYYFDLIKKWSIRVGLFCLIVCVIFFPVKTGTVIGTWIHNFFGTIIKNSIL